MQYKWFNFSKWADATITPQVNIEWQYTQLTN